MKKYGVIAYIEVEATDALRAEDFIKFTLNRREHRNDRQGNVTRVSAYVVTLQQAKEEVKK